MFNSQIPTFIAEEDLPINSRLKPGVGKKSVVLAGSGERSIGTNLKAVSTGDDVPVRLRNNAGTVEVVASEAFAVNVPLYGAAGGKTTDTDPGSAPQEFISLEAATADGDIVEAIYF